MNFEIKYYPIPELTKLGWLCCLDTENNILKALHGNSVECKRHWMVEGVWDNKYEKGEFHQSENFFGSGIRIEDAKVYFVPSSASIDRIYYCIYKKYIIVSNSLLLLLGFTNAKLDTNYGYSQESLSILNGYSDYKKEFRVIHPDIDCFYEIFYENIIFSKGEITFEVRSKLKRIDSYGQYHQMLKDTLIHIKDNYESTARKIPISPFTTLSTGYDSTAVSCLARDIGVKKCFTTKKSSLNFPNFFFKNSIDDGTPIAEQLNLDIFYLSFPTPDNMSEDELFFLAMPFSKFSGKILNETVFYSMAQFIEDNCKAAVVFCGYHGDKVWDIYLTKRFLNDQIRRGDTSGLNLSEIRLKSGFINVPVPFISARNVKDINKISNSAEMKQWKLNNSYDRPIPRRIAEDSGVSRDSFGMKKKFVAMYNEYPKNKELRKKFFGYLKNLYNINALSIYSCIYVNQANKIMKKILWKLKFIKKDYNTHIFLKDIDFTYLMWIWSAEILKEKFTKIFKEHKNIFEKDIDLLNIRK